MRYPGGKGTCYPRLLNLMPPHSTYVETHLGGGAAMRRKVPAERQVGVDADQRVIERWKQEFASSAAPCEVVCSDAVDWIVSNPLDERALIYADPPYVAATRRRGRVYRHDYTDDDHVRLINTLRAQRCMVMISGYQNSIYDELLHDWQRVSFQTMSHSGVREETVWMNYEMPQRLHDVNHLGDGFRDREVIRRRRARLHDRISRLPLTEQHGLFEWLQKQIENSI
jgi:DNA adenine methylase